MLVVVASIGLTACDSWAESARNAEEAGLDAAFSTTNVSIVDDGGPAPSEEPTTTIPSFEPTTTSAAPTTTASPSSTATPSTLAPARTVPAVVIAPPSPSTTSTTTTTTIPVVALSSSTTVAPADSIGWVAVLASLSTANYTRSEAAAWRLELGIDSAEILLSNDYVSLTPGYWVLYRGPYPDHATAVDVCSTFAASVPGCYPRQLAISG